MDNDISFLIGINDRHLQYDNPKFTYDRGKKIIYLIKIYPLKCPVCDKLMSRNGFKQVTTKTLRSAEPTTILKIKSKNISVSFRQTAPIPYHTSQD